MIGRRLHSSCLTSPNEANRHFCHIAEPDKHSLRHREGRFVTGSEKENFKIFEDKVLQQVVSFSSEDVPVSVGIILDVSGSMREKLKTAVKAAITFTE